MDPRGEYSLLFANNPIPMWVFDPKTLRFLDVNHAAVAKYGFTRDEFLGMSVADIRLPEEVQALKASIADQPEASRELGTWRHRHKDGTVFAVQITTQAVTFEDRPARLVLAQDITERDRERRFLQSVLDNMPGIVFVKDLEHRFTMVNAAWAKFTGVPIDRAIGKTARDVFPANVAERIHRDDAETFKSGTRLEIEETIPAEKGSRVQLTSRSPIRTEEGRINGLVGLAIDITDRKKAEEKLREYERVVEQAAESIVITDRAGRIVYVNPAFESVSGYSRSEALGQNPRILKSGHQDAAFYRRMWDALVRGEVWRGRFVNRHKNGTLYEEDARIGPVRDASGRIVNYVGVKRDVTNEMRLERQLVQAQKMEAVGRLAGGVAHDFNNLLGVITGYGELAQAKLAADDPLRGKMEQILKAADRAAGLTRQLLAFSRQQVLQPKIVDLNALVSNLEKMLRRLIGEDVDLKTFLDPKLGSVKADPGQIEQILMNLSINARDAMPDGGHLTIETSNVELGPDHVIRRSPTRPGPYVLLAVTDSGTGMDAEIQAHIFEPFFTTKEIGKGTGLGLATVYGIVKQSDGYIWCYSEVGVGTTFKVYLPRIEDAAASDSKPTFVPPRGGKETVLLIEDDQALRDVLSETLQGAGYTILVAEGGAKALEMSGEYHGLIHALVTDVIMPGLSGRAAATKIKVSRPELEVLFISGYTSEAIAKHGVLEPGTHFLTKPFTPADLLRKVRAMLDSPSVA
jgi:PAS domain S-box-containing protein